MSALVRDPWSALAALTPARIALGRAGSGLPTAEVLKLALAHAQARDAVHVPLAVDALALEIEAVALGVLQVESQATDRRLYLRRPDLGRRLSAASRALLDAQAGCAPDIVLVVADGLSAAAVAAHAVPTLRAAIVHLQALGLTLAPVVIAQGARVALGDDIAASLGAQSVAVLIGERPGLSSPDSLGIYFTYGPTARTTDADRNCISNIRAAGLGPEAAGYKLAWLAREARLRKLSGIQLKDESDASLPAGTAPPALSHAERGETLSRAPAQDRR